MRTFLCMYNMYFFLHVFVPTYIHSFIHSITYKHLFRDMLSISWAGKESTCNERDPGLIPGSGRSTGEGIGYPLQYCWASLVAQLVKNPPAMWETWVWSLGWEDPLEKGKATHSSILPGEFHGLDSPWGRKESDTTEQPSLHFTSNGIKETIES